MRKSWEDIDILAVRINDGKVSELIVGEVKAEGKSEREIHEINEKKFENRFARIMLKRLFGETGYKKYLFCWSWTSATREFAEKLGIVPVSFNEIVKYMTKEVEGHKGWLYLKDHPNLMLLQFLESNGSLRVES